MTRILLLGLGRWGENHLRVLSRLPVELYAVDLVPQRLESARKLGIPDARLATDYQAFKDKIDGAVVVTPAPSHFALVKDFLEAGKDVFVEKPITLESNQARQLSQLADARQRILQVGHIFRFDTASEWLKRAIQERQFGQIQMVRASFCGFKRPRADSGVVFADAVHFIDLFNFLLDGQPHRVQAVYHDFLGRGSEDAALISLEYRLESGTAWGMVEANYFYPGKQRELVIIGTEKSAVCDFNVSQYKIQTFNNRHHRTGQEISAITGEVQQIECAPEEPLLAELRAFVASLHTRQSPRANGWAGYDSVRVLEAAAESARTGTAVPFPARPNNPSTHPLPKS